MTILTTGGGLQTKSLRLKDSAAHEWVLRMIQKYPERELPPNLRAGLARDILQDQVITGHPYSSLSVPPLAEALGVPHAHPEIVYVPDDPLLGDYRKEFGNAVFLLEEKNPSMAAIPTIQKKYSGSCKKTMHTSLKHKLVLRAGLLDLITGDLGQARGPVAVGQGRR